MVVGGLGGRGGRLRGWVGGGERDWGGWEEGVGGGEGLRGGGGRLGQLFRLQSFLFTSAQGLVGGSQLGRTSEDSQAPRLMRTTMRDMVQ